MTAKRIGGPKKRPTDEEWVSIIAELRAPENESIKYYLLNQDISKKHKLTGEELEKQAAILELFNRLCPGKNWLEWKGVREVIRKRKNVENQYLKSAKRNAHRLGRTGGGSPIDDTDFNPDEIQMPPGGTFFASELPIVVSDPPGEPLPLDDPSIGQTAGEFFKRKYGGEHQQSLEEEGIAAKQAKLDAAADQEADGRESRSLLEDLEDLGENLQSVDVLECPFLEGIDIGSQDLNVTFSNLDTGTVIASRAASGGGSQQTQKTNTSTKKTKKGKDGYKQLTIGRFVTPRARSTTLEVVNIMNVRSPETTKENSQRPASPFHAIVSPHQPSEAGSEDTDMSMEGLNLDNIHNLTGPNFTSSRGPDINSSRGQHISSGLGGGEPPIVNTIDPPSGRRARGGRGGRGTNRRSGNISPDDNVTVQFDIPLTSEDINKFPLPRSPVRGKKDVAYWTQEMYKMDCAKTRSQLYIDSLTIKEKEVNLRLQQPVSGPVPADINETVPAPEPKEMYNKMMCLFYRETRKYEHMGGALSSAAKTFLEAAEFSKKEANRLEDREYEKKIEQLQRENEELRKELARYRNDT